jgi:hypothetical protein
MDDARSAGSSASRRVAPGLHRLGRRGGCGGAGSALGRAGRAARPGTRADGSIGERKSKRQPACHKWRYAVEGDEGTSECERRRNGGRRDAPLHWKVRGRKDRATGEQQPRTADDVVSFTSKRRLEQREDMQQMGPTRH